MSQQTIDSRVREVIVTALRLPPEAVYGDLRMSSPPAWDSLGHMSLMMAIEKAFGLRFPNHLLAELTSVDAIVKEIEKRPTPK